VKHLTGDIFGTPVVEAVRLQGLAAPGGILCSELVRALGGGRGGFQFEDQGKLELKGLAPVHAHRVRRTVELQSGNSRGTAEPAPARTEASVAVLPFVNMSPDADQEYFSDGLSEELINQLAQIKTLRVAGRTSTFAFKGKSADFREIGTKLGVSHVLEGSVRKAGQRLRITAQLITCADGFHCWSERFDRELDDVFAIQDEIARAVAEALSVTLGGGETRIRGGTQNVEAYDLMLRARSLIRRHDPERAFALLKRATALDPQFALGWNVLGNACIALLLVNVGNRDDVRKELDDALARSIALAPDLWTGHEARANQLELQHDWLGAEQANARARALAPKSMREPILSRAHQLAIVGRIGEALPFAREAGRVEPYAPNPTIGVLLTIAGLYDEAELEYERARNVLGPQFLQDFFALCRLLALRDHATAKKRLALCAAGEPNPRTFFAAMLHAFDDAPKALTLVRGMVEDAMRNGPDAGRVLRGLPLASYFGDHELVLATYRRVAKELYGVLITGLWHPVHAPMRKLPGFKDLVRDLGLVTYWRTTGEWGEFARPLDGDDFECS
jgi:TolB-like protein